MEMQPLATKKSKLSRWCQRDPPLREEALKKKEKMFSIILLYNRGGREKLDLACPLIKVMLRIVTAGFRCWLLKLRTVCFEHQRGLDGLVPASPLENRASRHGVAHPATWRSPRGRA